LQVEMDELRQEEEATTWPHEDSTKM
jgi:hypothetical protein